MNADGEAEAPIFWPPDVKSWLTGKDSDARKDWGQEEKGVAEDEMVEWHRQLNGYEFEQLRELVTEKAIAAHSCTLAWKIPWMEEPGRLQSMG